ncbi:MAG: arginine repressor [Lachnospiraceae bacterium]|nr:arginine repressor [Lachnospiraceae bacterium]
MKKNRQEKIKELIRNHEIETQEELAAYLNEAGYQVTQATVSRDIRELKLSKMAIGSGRQKYIFLFSEVEAAEPRLLEEKFISVLKSGFISVEAAGNIIVVKTVAGMAMAVAAAIDTMKWDKILGCIAGDDTIMIAVRSPNDGNTVCEKIYETLERI